MLSAVFGLARQLAAVDRVVDAVHALDEVPAVARHFTTARMTAVLLLLTAAPVARSVSGGCAMSRGVSVSGSVGGQWDVVAAECEWGLRRVPLGVGIGGQWDLVAAK